MTNNNVELLGWYGGDDAIALSAWTSTSRDLDEDKRSRIPKLINQLWSAEPVPHGTPFEKGIVHFLVDTDIASHIHILKHRLSNINAESARYKELKEDKYYLPTDWPEEWVDKLSEYSAQGNLLYHQCLLELTPLLGRKRAKESARFFKGYNSRIAADVMFNMRSFHNFINQRMDGHAQLEIREIARQMLDAVKSIEGNPFEHTLAAWGFDKIS